MVKESSTVLSECAQRLEMKAQLEYETEILRNLIQVSDSTFKMKFIRER